MTRMRGMALSFVCVAVATSAGADSDEASITRATLPEGLQPLLALIVDTSAAAGAMPPVREPYDAARDYGAALPAGSHCDPALLYWRRGAGAAPDCRTQTGLPPFPADGTRGFQCDAARVALDGTGFYIASRAAQRRSTADGGGWAPLQATDDGAVECRADAQAVLDWDRAPHADPYIFYTGNFLNWLLASLPTVEHPLAGHVATNLATTLRATDELEIAWLRLSPDDGGYVAGAPMPASQAADRLDAIAGDPPAGGAPLAEALVESALWLAGGIARFGAVDEADSRAFDALAPAHYQSPITHACRPVTLAYLTPGEPSNDDHAGSAAASLPGFTEQTGGCGNDCLPAVSQWLAQADLRADLPARQSVALQFMSPSPPPPAIAGAATVGKFARLDDPLGVINLVARSLQRDAAIPAAPQLSAAALLPATDPLNGTDVVLGLSAPQARQRWNGNLFRYALRTGESPLEPPIVVDRNGEDAIGPDGLPRPSSQSAWSDAPDADLLSGAAAGRLPVATERELYADLGNPDMTSPTNRLDAGNPRVEPTMLGLGSGAPESIQDILEWLAQERHLGDPGLHAPVVARYPDALQLVFAATHDGLLHAFDAGNGVERWAWMPAELLPRLAELMRDEPTTVRSHGIDGPLVLHRHDPDGDGRIDTAAGEHLWLLFGLGRGGNRYYAIDVSRADAPRLLWSMALPSDVALESRAEPVITRIHVDGQAQNASRWVALIAGGYDRRYDAAAPVDTDANDVLHMVDAETGSLLWSAGSAPDSGLLMPGFDASQPSAPRALDLDGDGLLDRAYLVDVAGGLWRLDFASGRAPAELAQARRLAQLGTGPQRFHATPDVSLVRFADGARLAISAGSGWLARPLDRSIVDRIYTIFDHETASDARPLTEADLHDADAGESMPPTAPGWFRRLDGHGAGEKVIGPSVTFDHVLRFQTWQPMPPDAMAPCGPAQARRRLYAFSVRNGASHAVAIESPEEDLVDIPGSGLPVALRFGFAGAGACPGCLPRAFGIIGAETFDAGYAGDPVRTSWRKLAVPTDSR
ncbi:MAG TPA: PilC/PilY family type IV pilus protein [Steroidobacteraceae bacterium]|nr:PilC/PilY family type IV pilus protein [Steroidobacteraceae bacterium]